MTQRSYIWLLTQLFHVIQMHQAHGCSKQEESAWKRVIAVQLIAADLEHFCLRNEVVVMVRDPFELEHLPIEAREHGIAYYASSPEH